MAKRSETLLRMWEVLGSCTFTEIAYPASCSCDFLQSPANNGTVLEVMTGRIPPRYFPIHYSVITLSFNAVQSYISALLNKYSIQLNKHGNKLSAS
jgi:hypothetical protein